ncbi:MAG: SUMF1/EgtB/PvdO family nonheme iron enzyme [Planctomycetes bacterium]|nr:SUMF1/EgtB/PvdO family nonheme iron enzyme [Planctomycetota bacterium]MCB9919110.1 SUMF1/EgtB/PvdO family nonheme iron enzyme [Planctomycetota bacterium]
MDETLPDDHDGPETHDGPATIGPYRVLGILGEGGMGVVYLGEQRVPVRRRVAIKVIKLGMDTKEVLARFDTERQALSLMEHANIARVFDAGSTESGQPWFAMELVKGEPITTYCDGRKLGIRERLELFLQVCSAVQHAHMRGVMHRDLKPSNILAVTTDSGASVKVIDFGLAKATAQPLTEATLYTQQGQILGTPEYMAPEQAGLSATDIDTRSDVYSLAVVLYELLAGGLPFRREELFEAGFLGMLKLLRETDPPKPSTRITTLGDVATEVAARRQVDEHALRKRLRGDLDWIVMRGLEKDRARRYQSARELADDVERHLHSLPVLAGPPRFSYRASRFVRRHRGAVIATGLVLASMVAGIVFATKFAFEANAAAKSAEASRKDFDMLAAVVQLDTAEKRERELHPPWPSTTPALEAWLRDDYGRLAAMRPKVEATLRSLRTRGETITTAERFLSDTLGEWTEQFDTLVRTNLPSVERRLAWSKRIDALTTGHPNARVSWEEAREAIRAADGVRAHERYSATMLDISPQTGLVPIGMNPVTKLWEFYDLRTACDVAGGADPAELAIPRHERDGSIVSPEDRGLVFVLVPGGRFVMGAMRDEDSNVDARLTRFDASAEPNEGPCHEIELAPFFLSRYEMTQGQWAHMTDGEYPSMYRVGSQYVGIGTVKPWHPVESVSHEEALERLKQQGLDLPTEAQWEYACRAGTTTRFWTGDEPDSLEGVANVLDVSAQKHYPEWGRPDVNFDDGYAGPAPCGLYRPNPWGFYDIHGNVMEWARDAFLPYECSVRAGDGLRYPKLPDGTEYELDGTYSIRDGHHQGPSFLSRAAARDRNSNTVRMALIGVRPSRAVMPRHGGRR